jgi:L-threonylcarbamoyladenylate synthase
MTTLTKAVEGMVGYSELENAIGILRNGGLLLYPTDTIWSIGCDATDPVAVERVCNLKGRKSADDFEILVDSLDMLGAYVEHLHPKIETLLAYHVRPLTVLFERGRNLPERLLGKEGRVAIRIVRDAFCRALIGVYGAPLVASPAAPIHQPHPHNFGAVSSAIIEGVDYVVKYRQSDKRTGEPAVMITLADDDELVFLRE